MMTELSFQKLVTTSCFSLCHYLTVPVAWYWIVAGFLLMHFTAGLVLASIFQTAHVVPTSEYPMPDENGTNSITTGQHISYIPPAILPRKAGYFHGRLAG
jgi:linoleoyl-CoA desaturase